VNPQLIQCQCQRCGGGIEFNADDAAQVAECPHCHEQTWIDAPEKFQNVPPPAKWKMPRITRTGFICGALSLAVIGLIILAIHDRDKEHNWAGELLLAGITISIVPVVTVICAAIYFLPTLVARRNKKRNWQAILVLNIALGWTFLGWVGALIWACVLDPEK
jgi:hypothetical protein